MNDVVITSRMAQPFQCPVRNHFIDIHVSRSSSTTLEHVDRKLRMKVVGNDVVTRGFDRARLIRREVTKPGVCPRSRFFYECQSTDKRQESD